MRITSKTAESESPVRPFDDFMVKSMRAANQSALIAA